MMMSTPSGGMLARGFREESGFPWPLMLARDVFELRYGKALVENSRRAGPVPVFGTNGQCGWHDTPFFRGPGVVLGRKGQGPLGVEWVEQDYWVIDTAYSLTILRSDIDLKYAYYLIKYVGLNHLKDGTSNPSLSRDTFGAQVFPMPNLAEQHAIAHILGTLDDKIELNCKMNETLEAMARTIFKSWFIDFGHNGGEMPGNWATCSLDTIASFLNGLALQKYPPTGDSWLPVIKIAQMRTGTTEGADKASVDIDPNYIVEAGDVLFSWSGSLVVSLWCGGRGALNQHLFKVTSARYPKWFYYLWLQHHLPDFQEIAASKATTMGHIQRHHLSSAMVVVPSDAELVELDDILGPILDRIVANNLESITLKATRDALLPKLLSGELRINTAEPKAAIA